MARRFDYSQTVIGNCGHACSVWPQIHDRNGPTFICETCTRLKHGVDIGEGFTIWVPPKAIAKPVEVKPKQEHKPKKPKPLTGFSALLQQEGLL